MKKKRQPSFTNKKQQEKDEGLTLSHMLNADIVNQLKNKQRELAEDEKKRKEEAERQKREAKRLADKNKTFEQLLMEDNKDWRNFK
ncbi:MAG: YqkE family protein [Bacillus sp. (in: firmicutes)]